MAKLFTIFAELGLDAEKFNKGISTASKQGQNFAGKLSGGLQKVSSTAVEVGKFLFDVGKKAARAAASFTKEAVTVYAETEQLMGGIDTLFKNSASTVVANSRKAYQSAGMDANQYMQTVMGFSASLLQSLGGDTQKAAAYADMAVRDMADNANKFGTEMTAIQNAYAGFSKQNFTMLDNLKLGYGGTRSEMQRLLKDAEAVQRANGKTVRYNINSLSDIYEAIHVIQQEMGVTGTTAREASKTIAGSFNSFKAAWQNVMIGIGTGEEMDTLINNLFESGKNVVKNVLAIVPIIGEQALSAVDAFLQRFDLYRTMKNAFRVGQWQGLASAAVGVFKTAVSGFGEWARENGARFLADLWNGLSGDSVSAEKIKEFFDDLFAAAGTVLSGLKEGGVTVFQWIKDNGAKVAAVVGPMAAAFTALQLATSPLALALTGIIAFTTDWKKFEQTSPAVVKFFEDLSGIDFSTFISSIESMKDVLSQLATFFNSNPEIMTAISTTAAGLAVATGHPVIAAGLMGISVDSTQTAADRAQREAAAMDAWAAEHGYAKDQQPFFLLPGWKTGDPDYSPEAYEEYHKERIQNALEHMRKLTPSGSPAVITNSSGDIIPAMPAGQESGALQELNATIGTLTAAVESLPEAVQSASTAAVTNVTVEMDGQTVGRLVSRHIAREARTAAKTFA